ncbi:MAG: hypothetical protein AAFP04_14865 [Myxococcota bacterium]
MNNEFLRRITAIAILSTAACMPFQASSPDGFAAYEEDGEFRAVSPEGITFRVRAEDNEPPADLEFWSEALKNRMSDAGYVVVSDGSVDAKNGSGYRLELAAPIGELDYSYLVAIFVHGDDIVVVESAGEVGQFAARRDAIESALTNLRLK